MRIPCWATRRSEHHSSAAEQLGPDRAWSAFQTVVGNPSGLLAGCRTNFFGGAIPVILARNALAVAGVTYAGHAARSAPRIPGVPVRGERPRGLPPPDAPRASFRHTAVMRIDMVTEPGDPRRPNEDYASAALPAAGAGGVLVVLDGVTPPEADDGCRHGVPWFVARLGGALLELSGARRDLTLSECLAVAVTRTADTHRETCDLSHPRTPQATVVAARWDEEQVEHLVLSDSALLVEAADGTVHPRLDRRLTELPPLVRTLRDRARRSGAEEDRVAYVRAVEGLRNAPDGTGFYTAAADPAVAGRAVAGTQPREDVRALLALTDGATRWTETFHLGDWAGLCALVRKEGPRALVAHVRTAEAEAPPSRGKRHDDATVLFAELD